MTVGSVENTASVEATISPVEPVAIAAIPSMSSETSKWVEVYVREAATELAQMVVNLRETMLESAGNTMQAVADAEDRSRQLATDVARELHAAIDQEHRVHSVLIEQRGKQTLTLVAEMERILVLISSFQKQINEDRAFTIGELNHKTDREDHRMLVSMHNSHNDVLGGTFWVRLKWLLLGRL